MSRIPEFSFTLEEMQKIHNLKNSDYAVDSNPFYNFDFTEFILSQFNNDRDKVFVWPIACKLARLSTLLNKKGEKPNNESIQDSLVDIANYVILWKCDISRRNKKFPVVSDT